MTSWKIERDRLVAQTLAFVQGVEQSRPITDVENAETSVQPIEPLKLKAPTAQSAEIMLNQVVAPHRAPIRTAPIRPDNSTAVPSACAPVPRPVVSEPSADTSVIRSPLNGNPENASPAKSPPPSPGRSAEMGTLRRIPLTAASERDDILQRVASFRARQVRFSRERQQYYEAVQAKIRDTLGNDREGSPL